MFAPRNVDLERGLLLESRARKMEVRVGRPTDRRYRRAATESQNVKMNRTTCAKVGQAAVGHQAVLESQVQMANSRVAATVTGCGRQR